MTAPAIMAEEVEPARAAPPPGGLLQSAARPTGTGWENGLAWVPEQCGEYYGFSPCDPTTSKPLDSPEPIEWYRPMGFSVSHICTTLDSRTQDEAVVRRRVEAFSSYVAARELWLGTLTRGDSDEHTNAYLANGNAAVVPDTPSGVRAGLAALEEATMQASKGQQVFLHVAPSWVMHAAEALERIGNVLYTKLGNVVVADAGYPGTGDFSAGTSEEQTVTITGAPTGGNFTLTFDGQTTIAIGYDSPALDVQGALNSLSNLDGVVVTGAAGGPYTVTFPEEMGDVPEMTGDGSGLIGGTTPAVAVATTTPGVAPSFADTLTAYGTGPVQVRLSPIEVLADRNQRGAGGGPTNRATMLGERVFAATFDPCIHTEVTITALAG